MSENPYQSLDPVEKRDHYWSLQDRIDAHLRDRTWLSASESVVNNHSDYDWSDDADRTGLVDALQDRLSDNSLFDQTPDSLHPILEEGLDDLVEAYQKQFPNRRKVSLDRVSTVLEEVDNTPIDTVWEDVIETGENRMAELTRLIGPTPRQKIQAGVKGMMADMRGKLVKEKQTVADAISVRPDTQFRPIGRVDSSAFRTQSSPRRYREGKAKQIAREAENQAIETRVVSDGDGFRVEGKIDEPDRPIFQDQSGMDARQLVRFCDDENLNPIVMSHNRLSVDEVDSIRQQLRNDEPSTTGVSP